MTDRNQDLLRIEELLVERATSGLEARAQAELDRLLERYPELREESWELAAAELDRALAPEPVESMPAHLEAAILAAGEEQVRAQAADSSASAGAAQAAPGTSVEGGATVVPGDFRPASSPWSWAGWMVAAAAILLAVWVWPEDPSSAPTLPGELRATLLAEAGDAVSLDWTATEDPAAEGASGDVVWSGSRQQGTMTIRGLEVNDPTEFQYQLWIFDANRDERYPVDGGVFDVNAEEVIVPIDAKVLVDEATLFAVTVEKPGGVVVSSRERIVLLAQQAG